jgi:hypothetical protein
MRYYWEALFSVEYFPYWEFTMLMVLLLNLSMLLRVHKIQEDVRDLWANTFFHKLPKQSFWETIKEIYNGK